MRHIIIVPRRKNVAIFVIYNLDVLWVSEAMGTGDVRHAHLTLQVPRDLCGHFYMAIEISRYLACQMYHVR